MNPNPDNLDNDYYKELYDDSNYYPFFENSLKFSFSDLAFLNSSQNISSPSKTNNENEMQPFTPINNIDKNINKTTSEQYKIEKQISEVIYRQEKSKGNKDDEIDMKIDKRVLFTINDSFSTNQQTKKNANNITEKKNDNKENNKKKEKNHIGTHNKYSIDNIIRKCKVLVLNYLMDFINQKLMTLYNSKIGYGEREKQLKKINKEQTDNTKSDFNKTFLNKTIGEIFSAPISTRCSSLPRNKNEILIKELMNEEDEEKRIYFTKLFNLSFIECLEHFSNVKPVDILKGLKLFDEMKNDPVELNKKKIVVGDNDYLIHLDQYIKRYANIINARRSSKRKKIRKTKSLDM